MLKHSVTKNFWINLIERKKQKENRIDLNRIKIFLIKVESYWVKLKTLICFSPTVEYIALQGLELSTGKKIFKQTVRGITLYETNEVQC